MLKNYSLLNFEFTETWRKDCKLFIGERALVAMKISGGARHVEVLTSKRNCH